MVIVGRGSYAPEGAGMAEPIPSRDLDGRGKEGLPRLAVIGAGSMGSQIAQQAGLHGLAVRIHDLSREQLQRGLDSNRSWLRRRVERGRMSVEEMEAALARVRPAADLGEAVSDADLVIEAVVEDLAVKRSVFADLGRLAPEPAILASNSSTIGISRLADVSGRPDRCCNMHFFYPPLVMDLVEIVKGPQTSESTVARALAAARAMGRTPVLLRKEIDGFIVNRILHMATQEAYRLLDAGVASFKDIDLAVEKGLGWPLGPFRLGDLTGLDVTYNARLQMYRATGDPRYRPSPSLEAKVRAGNLGRKTGRGWYEYERQDS
ncbi:MAG TPA: 3-hydroxyacyl-CoA dehydrogenase family protein [Candidatus Dormibacteraeota bacterium]|nr:3-hydroxyacyl-CoA dehydrogenase family protein [Candidatus Dormibacteraeota bacterium]